jgi:hypothetical protein
MIVIFLTGVRLPSYRAASRMCGVASRRCLVHLVEVLEMILNNATHQFTRAQFRRIVAVVEREHCSLRLTSNMKRTHPEWRVRLSLNRKSEPGEPLFEPVYVITVCLLMHNVGRLSSIQKDDPKWRLSCVDECQHHGTADYARDLIAYVFI